MTVPSNFLLDYGYYGLPGKVYFILLPTHRVMARLERLLLCLLYQFRLGKNSRESCRSQNMTGHDLFQIF